MGLNPRYRGRINKPTIANRECGVIRDRYCKSDRVANGYRDILEILDDHTSPLQRARSRLMDQTMSADRRRGGSIAAQRALVIDESWPHPDRDAASQAVLSHMQGLQRLGWEVTFVPTAVASRDPGAVAALEAMGIA